jgi:XTP/dITP diphosphohydrolase
LPRLYGSREVQPSLLLATGNAGKLREYRSLLGGAGFELIPVETGVEETGETYEANATLKAEAAVAARGLPGLGDDTGVEVEALGGFPGARAARLAPTQPERTAALLEKLRDLPRPWRARFVCVIALAEPERQRLLFRAERAGEVVPHWKGTVGFGYDPVFLVPEAGRTFGEMDMEEKNRWSHRGMAARLLMASGALGRLQAKARNGSGL